MEWYYFSDIEHVITWHQLLKIPDYKGLKHKINLLKYLKNEDIDISFSYRQSKRKKIYKGHLHVTLQAEVRIVISFLLEKVITKEISRVI